MIIIVILCESHHNQLYQTQTPPITRMQLETWVCQGQDVVSAHIDKEHWSVEMLGVGNSAEEFLPKNEATRPNRVASRETRGRQFKRREFSFKFCSTNNSLSTWCVSNMKVF